MKTYTFFYFDSPEKQTNFDAKTYKVDSPRFDSAFNCFTRFLCSLESGYFDFMENYIVFNGFRHQCRFLSDSYIAFLSKFKPKFDTNFEGV